MLPKCDVSLAFGYKSEAQISRVLSERWFHDNGFCLSCESERLSRTPANTKASDFSCRVCNERYELKTFQTRPARKLVDGAYSALMFRIENGSVPTLMLLQRDGGWQIRTLTAIHHLFLTPNIIEKRRPLSSSARRAGWVGCNIRLDLIPMDAQIDLIQGGALVNRQVVREHFQRFNGLKDVPVDLRGWTTLTFKIIRDLKQREFSLNDVYSKERLLSASYPNNHNIRAKIRQQLQILRDLGYLEFCGHGNYRLLI